MKEDLLVREKHTMSIKHKTMTEHDRNTKSDNDHLQQHRNSANLEENSPEKNEAKVNNDNCRKEPQFTSISCSICSERFTEIRYLIEHLHLHERESLPQHSEQKTVCKQPNLNDNRYRTKDECFENRKSDEPPALNIDEISSDIQEGKSEEHYPIVNISSKWKKFKTQSARSTQFRKKRFKCKMRETQQKSNVKQHILTHSNEISCPVCSKVFKNNGCLTLHLRNHAKLKKSKQKVLEANNQVSNVEDYPESTETLVCEVNPEIFAAEENVLEDACTPGNRLDEFTQSANEESMVQTDIHTSNVGKKTFKDHPSTINTFSCVGCQKIFVGKKPQTCDNCKAEFSEQSNLEIIPVNLQLHSTENQLEKEIRPVSTLSMHSGKRYFKCNLCDQSFSSRSNLKQHNLNHKGERPFSCEKCGKTFKNKFSLTRHLPIHCDKKQHAHTKQKRFEESAQNADDVKKVKTIIQISNIEGKTQGKHPSTTNIFSCEDCQKIFVGEKPRACDNCQREFTKQSGSDVSTINVQRHSKNDYLCEVCGKNFNGSKALANHRQGHFKEKRFKCNVCEKLFLRSSTLNRHLLLHSGETPFSCEDCGVSFSHERDLTRHLTGISLIHLTDMEKKKHRRKTFVKTHFEKHSESDVSKKSSENDNQISNDEEKASVQPAPTISTFSCKVCQKEFVGKKPTACDKCQTELPEEPCLDVAAISLPNESIEKPSSDVCSDKTTFKCFFCPESFFRINCLQVHVLCHSPQKVTCGLCGNIFKATKNLAKHLHLHTGEKSHKCDLCGKSFLTKFYLEGHLRVHSDERPFLCEVCGKSYRKKFDLVVHLQSHSNEGCHQSVDKPFECEICHERFFAKCLLKKHRCEASSSQELQGKCSCNVCGKEMLKGSLKRHLLSHSGDKPFKCEACEKSYKSKYELTNHLQTHSGEKPFPCEVCGKKFSSRKMLSNHRRYHSGTRSFACEFCPKAFALKTTLESHLRTHTGEKPFTCDICQKGFRQSGSLHMHRRIHEGVKAFVCEQCSRGFYTSSDLKRHRRICSGEERPFVCEICQKGFRYGSALTVHRRHHTGEKPFVCKVCNKSFRLCTSLQRHMRIHTGERPYKCGVCQKGFTQRYNLKIHLRTHSREAAVTSDLSNHTNDPDAPTSTGLPDNTRGFDVPVSSRISDSSHAREAPLSSGLSHRPHDLEMDLLHNTDGRHTSLHSGLPHCAQSLDASISSILPNQTHCIDGHMPSGLSNQQASGKVPNFLPAQPGGRNWYY